MFVNDLHPETDGALWHVDTVMRSRKYLIIMIKGLRLPQSVSPDRLAMGVWFADPRGAFISIFSGCVVVGIAADYHTELAHSRCAASEKPIHM